MFNLNIALLSQTTVQQDIIDRRKFHQFHQLFTFSFAKIYSAKIFPCVNYYIEDAATFTVLAKMNIYAIQGKLALAKFFFREIYPLYGIQQY